SCRRRETPLIIPVALLRFLLVPDRPQHGPLVIGEMAARHSGRPGMQQRHIEGRDGEAPPERAVLVALCREDDADERLRELASLAATAGADVVGRLLQPRDRPHPATYLGKGKLEELRALALSLDADIVVADDELRPAQLRTLSDTLDARVLDRSELILDIFAQRARSLEGKLQVELAQLSYLLPRLIGRGKEMSQIAGTGRGASGPSGVRGPGEPRLELDRRRLRHRMTVLRRRLEQVRKRRERERAERNRGRLATVALVGYTNAGKSTLLNALAGADLETSSKLFQTLDPTIRRADLGDGLQVLLSDTVGFIERLPHHLIAAFRATLEEVVQAELLVHVVDASSPTALEQMMAVREVLVELEAHERPTIVALNKCDLVHDVTDLNGLTREGETAVRISALERAGLDELCQAIAARVSAALIAVTLHIPYDKMEMLALSHEHGRVLSSRYEADKVVAEVEVEREVYGQLREYIVSET
ncbi:MAG: GTPase HflX, partial [Armatimonadota bacterium]